MNAIDKAVSSDITLGQLLDELAAAPEAPLVFLYEEQPVKAGYHVTEVKAGAFSALDCGANPEAWSEIFVQLWDIDEDGKSHMPAGRFSAIIRKVSDHVRLDPAAKLTFEVSDGSRPMALYCASSPRLVGGRFEVVLAARPSSCKPRDRWLAEQATAVSSCCAPANSNSKYCA
ncbi:MULTISPECIES: DUF6428 family protein [unclassified Shinella]|jgi:hypothetical protein|uniref:DUF6428 family protein n=1 Tax=unclassified Shinella TaxID=2643062 RepID=UPI00067FDA03|nr:MULTISPECIES: DUF6428 family protein [unclassified Shinella]KNY16522.1 hypothetical protein AKG11_12580 [Shinella sp. SUS2]KOC77220.1 hypothetical protein AKG10_03570 [Shinella sp. GWS1]MCO5150898.1 DUF6428 family protein [Shinella sp.]MDC7263091.1 hypothetical protein [Shinella sp. HY16]MDC7269986.1 hypothetical protein [Shinella sp. YZ44]